MQLFRMTSEELEQEVTNVKNLLISFLQIEGHISKEVADNLIYNYGIVIKKPSFFTRLWKKKNIQLTGLQYIIVKQLTIKEKSPDDNQKSKLTLLKTDEDDKGKDK